MLLVLEKGLVIFFFVAFSQTELQFLLYEDKLANCIYILNYEDVLD